MDNNTTSLTRGSAATATTAAMFTTLATPSPGSSSTPPSTSYSAVRKRLDSDQGPAAGPKRRVTPPGNSHTSTSSSSVIPSHTLTHSATAAATPLCPHRRAVSNTLLASTEEGRGTHPYHSHSHSLSHSHLRHPHHHHYHHHAPSLDTAQHERDRDPYHQPRDFGGPSSGGSAVTDARQRPTFNASTSASDAMITPVTHSTTTFASTQPPNSSNAPAAPLPASSGYNPYRLSALIHPETGSVSELGDFSAQHRPHTQRETTRLADDVIEDWGLLTELGPLRHSELTSVTPPPLMPSAGPVAATSASHHALPFQLSGTATTGFAARPVASNVAAAAAMASSDSSDVTDVTMRTASRGPSPIQTSTAAPLTATVSPAFGLAAPTVPNDDWERAFTRSRTANPTTTTAAAAAVTATQARAFPDYFALRASPSASTFGSRLATVASTNANATAAPFSATSFRAPAQPQQPAPIPTVSNIEAGASGVSTTRQEPDSADSSSRARILRWRQHAASASTLVGTPPSPPPAPHAESPPSGIFSNGAYPWPPVAWSDTPPPAGVHPRRPLVRAEDQNGDQDMELSAVREHRERLTNGLRPLILTAPSRRLFGNSIQNAPTMTSSDVFATPNAARTRATQEQLTQLQRNLVAQRRARQETRTADMMPATSNVLSTTTVLDPQATTSSGLDSFRVVADHMRQVDEARQDLRSIAANAQAPTPTSGLQPRLMPSERSAASPLTVRPWQTTGPAGTRLENTRLERMAQMAQTAAALSHEITQLDTQLRAVVDTRAPEERAEALAAFDAEADAALRRITEDVRRVREIQNRIAAVRSTGTATSTASARAMAVAALSSLAEATEPRPQQRRRLVSGLSFAADSADVPPTLRSGRLPPLPSAAVAAPVADSGRSTLPRSSSPPGLLRFNPPRLPGRTAQQTLQTLFNMSHGTSGGVHMPPYGAFHGFDSNAALAVGGSTAAYGLTSPVDTTPAAPPVALGFPIPSNAARALGGTAAPVSTAVGASDGTLGVASQAPALRPWRTRIPAAPGLIYSNSPSALTRPRPELPEEFRIMPGMTDRERASIVRRIALVVHQMGASHKRALAHRTLNHVKWSQVNEEGMERDDCCAVCQDEYEPDDKCVVTACKHMYHEGCLDTWLNTPAASTCPMCRRDLASLGFLIKVTAEGPQTAHKLWLEAPADLAVRSQTVAV